MSSRPKQPLRLSTKGLGRFIAVVGGASALAIALGTAYALLIKDRLPPRVASHWGTHGVDSTQTPTAFIVTAGLVMAGLALVIIVLAAFIPADGRRILGALQTGLTGVLGLGLYGSLHEQIGITDPMSAPDPGKWIGLGCALGIPLAVLAWRLLPPPIPAPPTHRDPIASDAPHVAVSDDERLAFFAGTPLSTGPVLAIAALVVMAVGMGMVASPWATLFPIVIGAAIVVMFRARLSIDDSGVRVRSFGRITWLRIPLEQVRSVSVTTVSPLRDYGGWGLRYSTRGRGFVTRPGPAISIVGYDGVTTAITIDKVDEAVAVLNTLVARLDRRAEHPPTKTP